MLKHFIAIVKRCISHYPGAGVMVSPSNHVRWHLLPALRLTPDTIGASQGDKNENWVRNLIKCLVVLVAFSFIFSCKKEHLQPVVIPGDPEPLVYVSAKLDGDSVYFAGGVNGYTGSPSVFDTGNNRAFNFTLKNPQLPLQSYFKISINNYSGVLGDPQSDLDNS